MPNMNTIFNKSENLDFFFWKSEHDCFVCTGHPTDRGESVNGLLPVLLPCVISQQMALEKLVSLQLQGLGLISHWETQSLWNFRYYISTNSTLILFWEKTINKMNVELWRHIRISNSLRKSKKWHVTHAWSATIHKQFSRCRSECIPTRCKQKLIAASETIQKV